MWNSGDDIKKRLTRREDMFLRRLFGMLAKMAKADGKMMILPLHHNAKTRKPENTGQV